MSLDSFNILLCHNQWATHRVLELAGRLECDELRRPFAIGPGSLVATLWHIVEEMEGWTDLANHRPPRKGTGPPILDLDRIRARFDAVTEELRELIRARAAGGTIEGETTFPHVSGRDVTNPHVICVLNALVHGTHHRAQCLNMLRQLGISPLPSLDVCDWYYQLENP